VGSDVRQRCASPENLVNPKVRNRQRLSEKQMAFSLHIRNACEKVTVVNEDGVGVTSHQTQFRPPPARTDLGDHAEAPATTPAALRKRVLMKSTVDYLCLEIVEVRNLSTAATTAGPE
jgi:hypothetical protein